jgi:NitT/TauT family transport system substrate-binding protein
VKRLEDMKGRVIATNAGGSAVDIAMRKMLLKVGLEQKRDYVMIEAPLPTMRAMLAEKKADLVPLVVPFSFDPELRRIAKPLFYNRDVMGLTQLLFWCARQSFIDKNRAAMVDFMEDTLRITYWFLDPANHAEVVAIASRLGLHQAGLLSRAGNASGPRRATAQRRTRQRTWTGQYRY